MASIQRVAVLGATGNLGPAIISQLQTSGFTVTAISRTSTQHTNSTPVLPVDLPVLRVDFTSFDELKEAFTGQDAVVSVVGVPGVPCQKLAVDAARAARVRRFVPSEFGVNTRVVKEEGGKIGVVWGGKIGVEWGGKIEVVDYLEAVKEGDEFSWTGIATGLILDWNLDRNGLGIINLKDKSATVLDSGNEKFQASTLAQVCRAVAGILKHPDETANKYVSVASFNMSENELVTLVEELTGWTLPVTHIKSADIRKTGEDKIAVADARGFADLLRMYNGADGAGHKLEEADSVNRVIGLPYEDLWAEVANWLRRKGAL
ncbi:hypothetical protein C8A05DRAFT_47427 [Staphylotrichum tortipilum]|uniref:NmrA-like domain-containing protein n=1 Tax=Staphylotrichum tortipilum TaxID=2831512 RepID=A0AAN6MCZ9_9PEZI|nr:hypothetical protein C8A05DRAFT_47427 [Staphylotrichum longicolle]